MGIFSKDKDRKILSRDEILNASDQVIEEVYIPAWNGSVYVKSLTGSERDQFEKNIVEWKGKGKNTKAEMKDNIRAKLVVLTAINPETKELLFTRADVDALGRKNASALDALFSKAQELSKLSDEDIDELATGESEAGEQDST